ncbi:MAG: DegT/DnrJ/EryC1/StrS family aminotransferase [Bacteroidota bacterium]
MSQNTQSIPFLDLKLQYQNLKGDIVPAVLQTMESAQFILGKAVEDFEGRFAEAHGMKHAVAVGSGTDALHLILWAHNIGPGDEVITVSHTFIATAEAVSMAGAKPVFVDVDPVTYNMDPDLLEAAITKRTKALIPVHLYGQPAPMDRIVEVARRHGLLVVEDACQAHLATYDGQFVGHFGTAAAFSFYPGKNLGAYGEAGGVTTNDEQLATRIRMLRDHGQAKKYLHSMWGHNYRMDGIQGAVLGVKLRHLPAWTEARRKHAHEYTRRLRGVGDLVVPEENPRARHVYHLYVIQTAQRDALQQHLASRGVATGLHYPIPLHLQEAYRDLGYARGGFPVTEKVAAQGLSLPMYAELTGDQIDHVISSVKEFFN